MNHKKGVTLIELIMGIIILSISVLSVAGVYQQIGLDSTDTRALTVASNLAESKMEEVLAAGFNIGGGSTGVISSGSFAGSFSNFSFQVIVNYVQPAALDTSVSPTVTDYKNVCVRVTNANTGTVTLTTLVTNP